MHKRHGLILVLGLMSLCAFGGIFLSAETKPRPQSALSESRVFAYRDWQATEYYLHPGDRLVVHARGTWLYSPFVGYHGPAGSRYHLSPASYPLPNYPGGILIGRIGETGVPFPIATHVEQQTEVAGRLYLRIDDDRVGDNDGALTVEIEVTRPPSTQPDAQPANTPRASRP